MLEVYFSILLIERNSFRYFLIYLANTNTKYIYNKVMKDLNV